MESLSQLAALDPAGMSGPDAHSWSIARGMYGNVHGDRVDGLIDDVRISDVALLPSDFLFSASSVLTNLMITGISVAPIGAGEEVSLEWFEEAGGVYQVQVATSLMDTSSNQWINVGTTVSAGNLTTTNTSGSDQSFYRIIGNP